MELQSPGMYLSVVIAGFCHKFNLDEKELAGITKHIKITQTPALFRYIATRELWMSRSEVAPQLNADLST